MRSCYINGPTIHRKKVNKVQYHQIKHNYNLVQLIYYASIDQRKLCEGFKNIRVLKKIYVQYTWNIKFKNAAK